MRVILCVRDPIFSFCQNRKPEVENEKKTRKVTVIHIQLYSGEYDEEYRDKVHDPLFYLSYSIV